MTMGIIELLEIIKVDKNNAQIMCVAFSPLYLLFNTIHEEPTIVDSCQGIMCGLFFQLLQLIRFFYSFDCLGGKDTHKEQFRLGELHL